MTQADPGLTSLTIMIFEALHGLDGEDAVVIFSFFQNRINVSKKVLK